MTARGAAVWLLLAAVWFGTLGIRPLYKADESRYAEISREMVASGDWVTPRLNGFKYFEKPPLQYWTSAAFFTVLGEKDWVARLWTALLGFAGVALTFYAGNRLFGAPVGAYAAAVLAGSPLYVLLGQVNTLDMSVSVFLAAAIFAFALGHMLLFWAACALAVLSKGLIGIVLPLGAIALYLLLKRDWTLPRRMRPLAGGALFLAITAPWFLAVSAANSEFARFFFIQEHFQRFTSEMHHRAQPAWYFVPILLAGLAPWLVPFAHAIRGAVKSRTDTELLLWCWAFVVFAFFSASGSKLPPYILPIFPALAVLIARALSAWVLKWQGIAMIPVALGLGLAIWRMAAGGPYAAYAQWLVIADLVLAVCAAAAVVFARRQRVGAAVLALAAGGLLSTQIGAAGHYTLSDRFSVATTVRALPSVIPADATVFAVDAYDHTIPWTLRRTVTMVGYRDELGAAVDWDAQRFIADLGAFARAWNAAPQAWAFVGAGTDIERLAKELGAPMREVARGPTFAIVTKP